MPRAQRTPRKRKGDREEGGSAAKQAKPYSRDREEGGSAAKRAKSDSEEASVDSGTAAAAVASSGASGEVAAAAAAAGGESMLCTRTALNGKSSAFKVVSWNINGIRAWVKKSPQTYLKEEDADVLCFQETKCDESEIPNLGLEGYHSYWSSAEKKGYAGTGLLSKTKPIAVTYGIGKEKHNDEGRVITAEYEDLYVVTAYVPNSGRGLVRLDYRKNEWDPDFRDYLKELHAKKPVVMCGDLNVSHLDIDLANPKSNKKNAGFTPEERDGFSTLIREDFFDSYRHLYPDRTGAYTFWSSMGNARAKNVGWRLDYFVMSTSLKDRLCDSVIRPSVMGSDHCPITLFLAEKS